MKKEEILVPKDKCPLEIISEWEEQIASAWIFLHQNLVHRFQESSDRYEFVRHYFIELSWNATEDFPATFLSIEGLGTWLSLHSIKKNNKLEYSCSDPEEIFFLKMEE